jgi:magnesium chelatase family protein
VRRYARRLSGPLLDRVDLYVRVDRVGAGELEDPATGERSAPVRARVAAARALGQARAGVESAGMPVAELAGLCRPTAGALYSSTFPGLASFLRCRLHQDREPTS